MLSCKRISFDLLRYLWKLLSDGNFDYSTAVEAPQMIELSLRSRAILRLIFDLNVDWTEFIYTPIMVKD